MTSYTDLLKQIETLTQQAEQLRKAEIKTVVADIQKMMKAHRISLADLKSTATAQPPTSKAAKTVKTPKKVAAKYRDTATGDTWSGRGRTPKWLEKAESEGQSREAFAV